MRCCKVFAIVCVILFVIDRLLKIQNLPIGEIFPFLQYSTNNSLLFLPNFAWIPWAALIILIAVIILFIKNPSSSALIPIILGGASNVFDRFIYGGVIDMIYIPHLFTANIADLLIFLGIAMTIFKSKKALA